MPGEMLIAVRLRPVQCGTELTVAQDNIPAMIPTEMCCLEWQESMGMLMNLVEAAAP